MKPLVIYHGRCTDGWTAAWIAARALGDVELFAGFYGQDPPDVKGRDVYVLDFSYKRPVMERIASEAQRLWILDHHVTAQADLEGLTRPELAPDPVVIFDMERSGARLAYDYFGRPASSEVDPLWLVNYVEDRDLWRWELPKSRLVSAAIECVPKTLDDWDRLVSTSPSMLIRDGEVIERYRRICIEAAVDLARPCWIAGHRAPAANTSEMRFASDTAHELADGKPFAATYWVRQDGIVQFSLRSREDGVDVSDIAKKYGGGGHRHAAGFQVPLADLRGMLEER